MNTIVLLLCFLLCAIQIKGSLESRLRFFEYCTYLGYPVQAHTVRTTDTYNLPFFRIQAKGTKIVPGKKVIYLQHGLVDSADTWIVNDEHLAPGLYLANLGYDVWVGNSRGNKYSTPKLNPKIKNFWDFSFDQMAKYDLPAAFKYIHNQTGRKIHYIGHSQGTLTMFIALSMHYTGVEENLASFNAFGPVAYLTQQKSKLMKMAAKFDLAQTLRNSEVKEVLLMSDADLQQNAHLCKVLPPVCKSLLIEISQSNNTVNNVKRLPVIMGHFPAGSSIKNVIHFDQYVKKAEFKMFDYGQKTNLVKYGTKTPPLYPLSSIRFPVHLYVGKYDKLADEADNAKLFSEMVNSQGKTMKVYELGHASFIWGKDLKHVDDAIKVIEASGL